MRLCLKRFLMSWIVLCLLICVPVDGRLTYKNIWRHLLSNYDRRLRPVHNANEALEVTVNVHVDHIISLDAKSQTLSLKIWFTMLWKDSFLTFNGTEAGIDQIAAEVHDIWTPDIFLYESLDEEMGGLLARHGFPLINSTGHALWIPPVITKSGCRFEVRDYPFDIQVCNLTFGSWIYHTKGIRLKWDDRYSYNRLPAQSGEWDVAPVKCQVEAVDFGAQYPAPYDMLQCQLVLARKPLFYLFNLVIPCLLLLLIGSATFFLPVNCGEKVSLSITILLAMTVFMLVLMENLPPTSDAVPFLGKFIVGCSVLLAMSTAMAVSIVNLSSRGTTGIVSAPPPRLLQAFVISCLARLVCFDCRKIVKLQQNENEVLKQNHNSVFALHNKEESEENEINGKDNASAISPNLISTEFTEDQRSFEMWVVIALVLDRFYLVVYFILMMIVVVIAGIMSSRSLS